MKSPQAAQRNLSQAPIYSLEARTRTTGQMVHPLLLAAVLPLHVGDGERLRDVGLVALGGGRCRSRRHVAALGAAVLVTDLQ